MSIVPPDPDSNTPAPHSLCGVAKLMAESADPFTRETGYLVDYIGMQHEPPVTCEDCRDRGRDQTYPCLARENAMAVAFAWLLRVIEERG